MLFPSVLCLEDKITTLSSCLVPKEVLGQGSQSPDQQQACTPLLQYRQIQGNLPPDTSLWLQGNRLLPYRIALVDAGVG